MKPHPLDDDVLLYYVRTQLLYFGHELKEFTTSSAIFLLFLHLLLQRSQLKLQAGKSFILGVDDKLIILLLLNHLSFKHVYLILILLKRQSFILNILIATLFSLLELPRRFLRFTTSVSRD